MIHLGEAGSREVRLRKETQEPGRHRVEAILRNPISRKQLAHKAPARRGARGVGVVNENRLTLR